MRQTQPTSTIGGYEDINMKIKILCAVHRAGRREWTGNARRVR